MNEPVNWSCSVLRKMLQPVVCDKKCEEPHGVRTIPDLMRWCARTTSSNLTQSDGGTRGTSIAALSTSCGFTEKCRADVLGGGLVRAVNRLATRIRERLCAQ